MHNAKAVAAGALFVAVCGLAAGFVREPAAGAHARYMVSRVLADQAADAARKLCMPLVGTEWERCTANALANQWRAVADADAAQQSTPEAYRAQRFVVAVTAFLVQTQHCGALPHPGRAACDKAAIAAYHQAISCVSASEVTEQGCVCIGCPVPARPASRSAKLREV